MPEILFGVDVGGSAVKLGAVAQDGGVVAERSLPVEPGSSASEVFGGVSRVLASLVPDHSPTALGVGVPGMLDRAAGRVIQSPNLPWLEGADVRSALARGLDLSPEGVLVENDANVAALGELFAGAGAGERHLLLLTLGTGVGGGLVLDGELFTGAGLAGEVGHMTIDPDGLPCGCGSRGCLETLASATAARRRATERGLPAADPGNLELLAERARAAAGPERELLFEVGRDLGHGLAQVISLLDLTTFVFGGGFSAALDTLEPGIRQGLEEWAWRDRVSGLHLRRATLGPGAGWIGAAYLSRTAQP